MHSSQRQPFFKVVYDCDAGYSTWQKTWSTDKKARRLEQLSELELLELLVHWDCETMFWLGRFGASVEQQVINIPSIFHQVSMVIYMVYMIYI